MTTIVQTHWSGEMKFTACVDGHEIVMDADPEFGGSNEGPRPKPLLLAALTGCAGMDIVSLLEKMKVKDYSFSMDAQAKTSSEHPVTYQTITLFFNFQGKELPPDKIRKAVNLSLERYCGVYAMLKKAANVIAKITINNQEIEL
ncbi:MAG TPA: OsmC family protein [Candidatus Cloacimonas sp.]|jgi:putative redox protein|nr:OsmC family protein [Candidatus Cloacimonas sp.]HPK59832.1 OsmC family protein [Candidatus Cloacimonas sp.]HPZ01447.1 OsmC family protein [Candidatus Cloacimonas sp.]HQJ96005.1 OsmC family protein [Candidatus Cloacimonas sp.]HQM16602.1 OsmC family protein [Candidatus Cloacimonas sp.]